MPSLLELIKFRQLVLRAFQNPPRTQGTLHPSRFSASLNPEAWEVDGFDLLTLRPEYPAGVQLLFLPGGAYLLDPSWLHRRLMSELARRWGLGITMLNYPKAPESGWQETLEITKRAFQELAHRFPDDRLGLMGDSAGGGLALSLLIKLRDERITPLPDRTVLISPWLDLTLSNPEIPVYGPRDPVLPLEGLVYAAERYARGEDLSNPLLSPVLGDLSNLGQILLIFGTRELFFPDCQKLVEIISRTQGTDLTAFIGKGKVHDWVIVPSRESQIAVEKIANFLSGGLLT